MSLGKNRHVSFIAEKNGSVAVLFAFATIPVLMVSGATIDYSRATQVRAQLQNVVDATALRALEVKPEERLALAEAAILSLDKGSPEVEVSGNQDDVVIAASANIKTVLLSIMRIESIPVSVRARARIVDRLPACLLALNEAMSGAVSFNGASEFYADDCVIHTNSKDAKGLDISTNSHPVAAGFCSAGGFSAPEGINPKPRGNCRRMADPLEGLQKPVVSNCNGNGNGKKNSVGSGETVTLSPGTFCGGLTIQGNATLSPGVYVINDGQLSVNAQAAVNGTGVTFYFTGPKSGFTINGGASVNIEAPTSGTYGGIVIFQDPLAIASGNKKIENTLNGGADTVIQGGIYTPNQSIRINGSSGFGQNSRYMPVIADTITVTGSSKINVDIEGIDMAGPLPMSTETLLVE